MFLVIRSPFGGKGLSGLWASVKSEKNVAIDPDRHPTMVGDYLTYKVGYAEQEIKKGEPIFIKRSDAQKLGKICTKFD